MKKRYEEIDIMRGIAIILVIIAHSIIYYPVNLHEINWSNNLFYFVSIPQMAMFFLVSGFCYSYKDTYKEFILKKVKRLLIPYLFFSAIDLLPRIFLSSFVNRSTNVLDGFLKIFFYGGELWFLYVLFEIFLIMPIIEKIFLNNTKKFFRYILIIILILLNCFELTDIFLINKCVHYIIFFIIGVILKKELDFFKSIYNKIFSKYKNIIILVLSSILLCVYIIRKDYLVSKTLLQFLKIMIELVGCLFWFIISRYICKNNSILKILLKFFRKIFIATIFVKWIYFSC